MPSNPNNFSSGSGENAGEINRTYQERGEKTNEEVKRENDTEEAFRKRDERFFKLTGQHLARPNAPANTIAGKDVENATAKIQQQAEDNAKDVGTGAIVENAVQEPIKENPETVNESSEKERKAAEAKKEQKNNKAVRTVIISVAIGATLAGASIPIIKTIANNVTSNNTSGEVASEQSIDNEQKTDNKAEQDTSYFAEINEFLEYDAGIDGTGQQYDGVGGAMTPMHTADNPNVGKFSQNSNAAPNDAAQLRYGKNYADCSEGKVTWVTNDKGEIEKKVEFGEKEKIYLEMVCKQSTMLASNLQILNPDYKNMDYTGTVIEFDGLDESTRAETILGNFHNFIDKVEGIDHVTVGELTKGLSGLPGGEEMVTWYEEQDDGTVLEKTTTRSEELSTRHTYTVMDAKGGHTAVEKNVATPDSAKVMVFTFRLSESETAQMYVLERCFNGFLVHTVTNTTTKETRIVVETFGDKEQINEKDVANAVAKFKQQAEDDAEDRGTDEIKEYKDDSADDPDGEVTEDPTKTQTDKEYEKTEEEIKQNPDSKGATDIQDQIPEENDYSKNKTDPGIKDNPTDQQKADENEKNPDNTPHDKDMGGLSIDDLLGL